MMRSIVSLVIVACCCGSVSAGESWQDFAGSWAFELPDGNPAWLRVQAETTPPQAQLLWSVGSAKPVTDLTLKDGVLSFQRKLRWQPGGRDDVWEITSPFTVRCMGKKLRLECTHTHIKTKASQTLSLIGRLMPPLPEAPNLAQVKFGRPISLFNGQDLTGWKLSSSKKKNGWRAEDGVLINETPKTDFKAYGEYGNLITARTFTDFRLTIEYNVPPKGNSGIYLRGMYEAQVVDRDSRMQGIQGPGAIFGRLAPAKNVGKPGGEWNRYRLTLVHRHITVELNGETVIENQPLIGCTGGGISADDTKPGPIFLQGDHTPVRYRNIILEPVIKTPE